MLAVLTSIVFPGLAFADNQDTGISVAVRSDKSSYKSGDDVVLTIDVKNGYAATLTGIKGKADLPENLSLNEGSSTSWNLGSLDSGDSAAWTIKANAKSLKAVSSTSKTEKGVDGKDNNKSMPFTGDRANWAPFALAGLFCLATGIALCRHHSRRGSGAFFSFLLVALLVFASMPQITFADSNDAVASNSNGTNVKTAFFIDGQRVEVNISITHDAVKQSANTHKVAFNIQYPDLIDNASEFGALEVKDGSAVKRPADPKSEVFGFDGWFADSSYSTPFDFSSPITEDTVVYAKLNYDNTDSDGDGMADGIERWYGSDPSKSDTDGDGLPDGFEIDCGTNPLLKDSNSNGISDYDEDADNDNLTNGEELKYVTRPLNPDTDNDGILDGDEIKNTSTNPLNNDTDGDGALDGWERDNGFDPTTFNDSFAMSVDVPEPSNENLVTAGVEVEGLNGSQASSLKVTPVSSADQNLVNPSIAGYMGSAYSFSVDGIFNRANITFAYDTSTFGSPSDSFRPEIYYVNEQTHCLEKVENQTSNGNRVTASVSHFSTYILLNGVPFDKAWETDIKSPNDANDAMAFCFTLDYSMSMDDNDPFYLRKDVTKSFVNKLRDNDQGALVSFIANSTVACPLTSDKAALNQAIDEIQNDDGKTPGVSGTNGTNALKTSLNELAKTQIKNKYILFMTDGDDTYYDAEKTYNDLIADAQAAGVKIYCVALGNANTSLLKRIADNTGGKCYEAKAGLNLEDIYKDIEVETVDLFTDSNDDGIPDYYDKLIYEGKLILSNGSRELTGIDFNYDSDGKPSNDYDHDGIKNGDEIQIVTTPAGGVYLYMKSDPTKKQRSKEDYFDGNAEKWLLNNENFKYPSECKNITENTLNDIVAPILSKLFGTDQQGVFKEELMSYLTDDFTTSSKIMDTYKVGNYTSTLKEGIAMLDDLVAKGKAPVDKISSMVSKANETIDKLNGVSVGIMTLKSCEDDYFATLTSISSFVKTQGGEAIWTVNCVSFSRSLDRIKAVNVELNISKTKLDAISSKLGAISSVVDKFDKASSLFKLMASAAELGSNTESIAESVEWLDQISTHGTYSAIKDSASTLKVAFGGNFGPLLKETVINYASSEALTFIEEAVSNLCPYGKIAVGVKEGLGAFFGIGEKYEDQFKLLTMNEGTIASCGLYRGLSNESSNGIVALSNVANLRYLGESDLQNYKQGHGFIGDIEDFFGANEKDDKWLDEQHAKIKSAADKLHLVMSSNL